MGFLVLNGPTLCSIRRVGRRWNANASTFRVRVSCWGRFVDVAGVISGMLQLCMGHVSGMFCNFSGHTSVVGCGWVGCG